MPPRRIRSFAVDVPPELPHDHDEPLFDEHQRPSASAMAKKKGAGRKADSDATEALQPAADDLPPTSTMANIVSISSADEVSMTAGEACSLRIKGHMPKLTCLSFRLGVA